MGLRKVRVNGINNKERLKTVVLKAHYAFKSPDKTFRHENIMALPLAFLIQMV